MQSTSQEINGAAGPVPNGSAKPSERLRADSYAGSANPPTDNEIVEMVKRLHATTDAQMWAREFNKVHKDLHGFEHDEGWLIGWFANAIEVGRDAGKRDALKSATREPMICYAMCKAHEGESFTMECTAIVQSVFPVCPICNPPPKP